MSEDSKNIMIKCPLILGGGFTGMITALAFSYYGIKSYILDKNPINIKNDKNQDIKKDKITNDPTNDPRTTALSNNTISFFKQINIWDNIKVKTCNIKDIYVVDNRSHNMLNLPSSLSNQNIGVMIPNSEFKKILQELAINNKNINIIDNSEYNQVVSNINNTIINLNDGRNINSELTIICDGKNSKIRKDYFKTFFSHDYNQTAMIFNISHTNNHDGSAIEHFLPSGVFACLPLKNPYQSSIVWACDTEDYGNYSKMDNTELKQHLLYRLGDSYGDIEIITKRYNYPLSANLSNEYYYNKLVLVGDSAHVIHPLAGQGLNQGIKDIKHLIDLYVRRYNLGLKISKQNLNDYQEERFIDNLKMFLVTHSLDKIFCNNIPILRTIRKFGLGIINSSKLLKKSILNPKMFL